MLDSYNKNLTESDPENGRYVLYFEDLDPQGNYQTEFNAFEIQVSAFNIPVPLDDAPADAVARAAADTPALALTDLGSTGFTTNQLHAGDIVTVEFKEIQFAAYARGPRGVGTTAFHMEFSAEPTGSANREQRRLTPVNPNKNFILPRIINPVTALTLQFRGPDGPLRLPQDVIRSTARVAAGQVLSVEWPGFADFQYAGLTQAAREPYRVFFRDFESGDAVLDKYVNRPEGHGVENLSLGASPASFRPDPNVGVAVLGLAVGDVVNVRPFYTLIPQSRVRMPIRFRGLVAQPTTSYAVVSKFAAHRANTPRALAPFRPLPLHLARVAGAGLLGARERLALARPRVRISPADARRAAAWAERAGRRERMAGADDPAFAIDTSVNSAAVADTKKVILGGRENANTTNPGEYPLVSFGYNASAGITTFALTSDILTEGTEMAYATLANANTVYVGGGLGASGNATLAHVTVIAWNTSTGARTSLQVFTSYDRQQSLQTLGGSAYLLGSAAFPTDASGREVGTFTRLSAPPLLEGTRYTFGAPTADIQDGASAVVGNYIYMFGGYQGGNPTVARTASYRWDGTAAPPTAIASMPVNAFYARAAPHPNGLIYVLVGSTVSFTGAPSTLFYSYDPAADAWTARASIGTARAYAGLTQYKGVIFATGGEATVGGVILSTTEYYNVSTDQWYPGPALSIPRSRHAAVSDGDNLYLISGLTTGPTYVSSTDVMPPQTINVGPVVPAAVQSIGVPRTTGVVNMSPGQFTSQSFTLAATRTVEAVGVAAGQLAGTLLFGLSDSPTAFTGPYPAATAAATSAGVTTFFTANVNQTLPAGTYYLTVQCTGGSIRAMRNVLNVYPGGNEITFGTPFPGFDLRFSVKLS